MSTLVSRIGLVILWLALTAAVAFLIARNAADNSVADVTAPLPPVELSQRATVALEVRTIAPVVSASGRVINTDVGPLLEAPAPSDDLAYRLLDPPVRVRALIAGGPAGFDCAWEGLGEAGGGGEVLSESAAALTSPPSGVTLLCRIPDDVRVAPGMNGTMVLQMDDPNDVSALPVTAVVGDAERGEVLVVNDDSTLVRREVTLGVADVYHIAVTDGLEPDERVLQNPTQADFLTAVMQS